MQNVLSVSIYEARFDAWFSEGGKRGKGILSKDELATLALRDLKSYFSAGDSELINFGKDRKQSMPKWRNQLAWALVKNRYDEFGNSLIQRKGKYYYHLGYTDSVGRSRLRKMRKVKRSANDYHYLKEPELKKVLVGKLLKSMTG